MGWAELTAPSVNSKDNEEEALCLALCPPGMNSP